MAGAAVIELDWADIASRAVERDPRKHPYGYFTGSSFVLATVQSFVWFKSIEELTRFIHDVEPRVYDLAPGEGLEELQARVRPLLARVRTQGLTRELRLAVDAACARHFNVRWWGGFLELCEGAGPFERRVLDDFLGEARAGEDLRVDDLDDFVEFVQSYGA